MASFFDQFDELSSSESDGDEIKQYYNNVYATIQHKKRQLFASDSDSSDAGYESRQVGGALTRQQAQKLRMEEKTDLSAEIPNNASHTSTSTSLNERRTSPLPSTSTAKDHNVDAPTLVSRHSPENVLSSTPPPPKINPPIWSQDSVVAENSLVSAHVYKAFHQHQKIFQ